MPSLRSVAGHAVPFVGWWFLASLAWIVSMFLCGAVTETYSLVNGTPADLDTAFQAPGWRKAKLAEILPPSATALTVASVHYQSTFPFHYTTDVYGRCHLPAEDFDTLREKTKPGESEDSGRSVWIAQELFDIPRGLEGKGKYDYDESEYNAFYSEFDYKFPSGTQTRYEARRSGDWAFVYDHEEQTLYLHYYHFF